MTILSNVSPFCLASEEQWKTVIWTLKKKNKLKSGADLFENRNIKKREKINKKQIDIFL